MVFSEQKGEYYFFHGQGLRSTSIKNELDKEGIRASVVGIWKFIKKYEQQGTTQRLPGSGCPSLVTP